MALIGHTEAFRLAEALLTRRRAFGLVAPQGVGRQFFVQELFKHFTRTNLGSDFVIINESIVSVGAIRNLDSWIQTKPIQASVKFLVLVPTERITFEAQHALLKLLEDTPDHLIVWVVVEGLGKLLPTIQSRLCPIRLFHLSRENTEAIWLSFGIEPSIYPQLWKLAPGQPGVAVRRLAKKYPAALQALNKFIQEDPTAIGLLQWQNQLPPEWLPEDHMDFWTWVAPRIFMAFPRCSISLFAASVSSHLQKYPELDTTLGVPALWHSIVRS